MIDGVSGRMRFAMPDQSSSFHLMFLKGQRRAPRIIAKADEGDNLNLMEEILSMKPVVKPRLDSSLCSP